MSKKPLSYPGANDTYIPSFGNGPLVIGYVVLDIAIACEEELKAADRLLSPLGVTLSGSVQVNPEIGLGFVTVIMWRTYAKAKGQFWDEQVITGHFVWDNHTPQQIVSNVLWAIYARINEPHPEATLPECHPPATIPEDYYAM